MAKRFIDTSFYKSPFVRGLKGSLKGLYSFIICDCDGAGIWSADFEIASVYVGQKIEKKDFEEAFLKTQKAIDLNNGKYFFPDFIQHQYPKGLSEKNPAQINVILELKKYGLIDQNLEVVASPFQGTKDKDMEEDMDKGMEEEKEKKAKIPFENFWNLYEKKVGNMQKLIKKWDGLTVIEQLQAIQYIPIYKEAQPDKQYRKNPETFLNNKSWNDEIIKPNETANKSTNTINSTANLAAKRGYIQRPHGN